MSTSIFVVDDDAAMGALLEEGLAERGYAVRAFGGGEAVLRALDEDEPDVLITDLRMAGMDGLALTREVVRRRPDLPVVLLTAFGDLDAAVGAIRAGAWDFLSKPVDFDTLAIAVDRAARHHALRREVRRLRRHRREDDALPGVIGDSPPMRRAAELVRRAARTDAPVLLVGETGTGKELFARALHALSDRADQPFVPVNCAAIPEHLVESELFGHVRGAFTDARTARRGLFVEAGRGTIFLDEIGELPLAVQPKLLRVLQEGRVRPVGADREVPVACRVVAATNRDLGQAVAEGSFRSDLFYRVAVIRLALPPLRQRAGDILLLARHFVERAAARTGRPVQGFTTPVAQALLAWPWPGNVRELENCMERAVALTAHDRIVLDDLPEEMRAPARVPEAAPAEEPLLPLAEVERRHIERVLAAVGDNKVMAARVLGLDRRTLYRKLERYRQEAGDA